jgi:polyhydroxybutyrate depolymerase
MKSFALFLGISISRRFLLAAIVGWFACHPLFAADGELRKWTVDGVAREALVSIPETARTEAAPLVFGFHGHGGSMRNAARSFRIHTLWPEAIVVYPQGLNTPGQLTDPEGKKSGWQSGPGAMGDRDLKFVDAMLEGLQKDLKVDSRRVFSTGHSNGGGFTYLLWAARGEKFAAFAPSASAAGRVARDLKPKPVFHIAAENDELVKFEWQKLMIEHVRRLNQCGDGAAWDGEKGCTVYTSKIGAPVITFIHAGGHRYPEDAPARIVKFFKLHALREATK